MRRLVTVGNPENRRVRFLREACEARGIRFRAIAYRDLLNGETELADNLDDEDVLRFESFGENAAVWRELLVRGAAAFRAEGGLALEPGEARVRPIEHGEIVYPRQAFLGYVDLLESSTRDLDKTVRVMNAAPEILLMFDKTDCARHLRKHGLETPEAIGPIRDYDHLVQEMQARGWRRVFVKIANGSSASGTFAITRYRGRAHAVTTLETVRTKNGTKCFNSLRLRSLSGDDAIRKALETLKQEKLHAERWLQKDTLPGGEHYDLRVLTVAGEPTHVVARCSRTPLTNLHLLNRRATLAEIDFKGEQTTVLESLCKRAAGAFPRCHYTALDILVSPRKRTFRILEVNAFGDLLPGLTDKRGFSTYERELHEWE